MLKMEVQLKHPFSLLVSGGRGVGKTEFTKQLLQYQEKIITPSIDRVVWCYAKHQPKLYDELVKINENIEYVRGIPENLDEMFNYEINNLIVIDDLMDEGADDKRVSQLFTRGRHDNLSVVFLTQNLFHAKQRVISLNADYIIVFKNPRDGSQFAHLARQVMPQNTKFLTWAYKEATENPHSYLLLDLKAETNDRYRVRSNILPNDGDTQFVYMPSR